MTAPAREIPYPATTQSKGWRFELDMPRIMRSTTWTLTPSEARPYLLMLWAQSWEQTPCGSLPNDDEVIAAYIGIPLKTFMKYRAKLMRNFWLADDGRLYHDAIIERVQEMLERRDKDRLRKQKQRASDSDSVPWDNHGTTSGFQPESSTGTSTRTSNKKELPTVVPKRKKTEVAKPVGVAQATWEDFLRTRKVAITATALVGIEREAAKARITLHEALEWVCIKGYKSFKADWYAKDLAGFGRPVGESFYERDLRIKQARHNEMIGRKPAPASDSSVIDVTPAPMLGINE